MICAFYARQAVLSLHVINLSVVLHTPALFIHKSDGTCPYLQPGIILTNVPTYVGLGITRSSSSFNPFRHRCTTVGVHQTDHILSLKRLWFTSVFILVRHPVDYRQLNVCTADSSLFSPKSRCNRVLRLLNSLR